MFTQWGEYKHHALSFVDAPSGTIRRDQWTYWNFEGLPAPALVNWFPTFQTGTFTGQGQATWDVEATSQYVLYGGEFTRAGPYAQQGLARFAVSSIAPDAVGPDLNDTSFPINVVSPAAGQVRVTLPANYDRDDLTLTYQLLRDGSVVQTRTASSTFWDQPTVSFFDSGLTPGQSHSYRVRASDPDGNFRFSPTVPVVVSAVGAPTTYADRVIADDARIYWRLGESPGATTAVDAAGQDDATINSFTLGRPGAILGDVDTAARPISSSSRIVHRAERGDLVPHDQLAGRPPAGLRRRSDRHLGVQHR
jgi:hypothetical protein